MECTVRHYSRVNTFAIGLYTLMTGSFCVPYYDWISHPVWILGLIYWKGLYDWRVKVSLDWCTFEFLLLPLHDSCSGLHYLQSHAIVMWSHLSLSLSLSLSSLLPSLSHTEWNKQAKAATDNLRSSSNIKPDQQAWKSHTPTAKLLPFEPHSYCVDISCHHTWVLGRQVALVCANLCYVAHMFINKIKRTRRENRLMIVDPVVIIINVQYCC